MPKLTPEESKAIGGSAAEEEKRLKAIETKKAQEKLGKSVDKVTFKKGELKEGTRVVGEPEKSESPKQQLKKKPKPLPKAKPRPTVGRGAGGRIVSLKKTKPVSKRKQTRTGKKIDRATGKIAVPLVRRGEGGRSVGTTPEERKAAITTVLPEAGPEVMLQPTRTQTEQPQGTLRQGGQRVNRGFVAPYKLVKAGVDAALGHLSKMKETQGTPEFDDHHQAFNAIHQNLAEIDPHGLGISLGQLKHQTLHGAKPRELEKYHRLIQDRLEEGRRAHEENVANAQAGRERKAAQNEAN